MKGALKMFGLIPFGLGLGLGFGLGAAASPVYPGYYGYGYPLPPYGPNPWFY